MHYLRQDFTDANGNYFIYPPSFNVLKKSSKKWEVMVKVHDRYAVLNGKPLFVN